jgi:hypothetical protein
MPFFISILFFFPFFHVCAQMCTCSNAQMCMCSNVCAQSCACVRSPGGGYAWALTEGLFGIDFFSDSKAAATIHDPLQRMDSKWAAATAHFVLRGTNATLVVTPSAGTITLHGVGPKQQVRLIAKGTTSIVCIGTGCSLVLVS